MTYSHAHKITYSHAHKMTYSHAHMLTVQCHWPRKGPITNADMNSEPLPAPPPTSTKAPQVSYPATPFLCHAPVFTPSTCLNFAASSGFRCGYVSGTQLLYCSSYTNECCKFKDIARSSIRLHKLLLEPSAVAPSNT